MGGSFKYPPTNYNRLLPSQSPVKYKQSAILQQLCNVDYITPTHHTNHVESIFLLIRSECDLSTSTGRPDWSDSGPLREIVIADRFPSSDL
jgi:hypothetical protein